MTSAFTTVTLKPGGSHIGVRPRRKRTRRPSAESNEIGAGRVASLGPWSAGSVRTSTSSYVKVVVLQRDHDWNRRPHRHGAPRLRHLADRRQIRIRPKAQVLGVRHHQADTSVDEKLGGLVLLAVQRGLRPCDSEYPHRRTPVTPNALSADG